jgi:hypothetical protein
MDEVEGEIRAFVRRDALRRQRPESEATTESPTRSRLVIGDTNGDYLKSLIERISVASVSEIERALAELSNIRDTLRTEGERIQREIVGYATISETAMRSTRVFAESLAQWQSQAKQISPSKGG